LPPVHFEWLLTSHKGRSAMPASGRLRPVVTLRDFSVVATCYAELNGRVRPIVLKKSISNFFSKFSVACKVQLIDVRVIAVVLKSRVTNPSFPSDTEADFFNTIGQKQSFILTLEVHFYNSSQRRKCTDL